MFPLQAGTFVSPLDFWGPPLWSSSMPGTGARVVAPGHLLPFWGCPQHLVAAPHRGQKLPAPGSAPQISQCRLGCWKPSPFPQPTPQLHSPAKGPAPSPNPAAAAPLHCAHPSPALCSRFGGRGGISGRWRGEEENSSMGRGERAGGRDPEPRGGWGRGWKKREEERPESGAHPCTRPAALEDAPAAGEEWDQARLGQGLPGGVGGGRGRYRNQELSA